MIQTFKSEDNLGENSSSLWSSSIDREVISFVLVVQQKGRKSVCMRNKSSRFSHRHIDLCVVLPYSSDSPFSLKPSSASFIPNSTQAQGSRKKYLPRIESDYCDNLARFSTKHCLAPLSAKKGESFSRSRREEKI